MKRLYLVLFLSFILLLTACGASDSVFVFTEENFPKMDGSTANIPLGQAVAAAMLGKSYDECEDYVNFTKTSQAYFNFIDGKSDILLIYEPSEEVLAYKKENNFEWEMAPIGRDGLVFLVNHINPVSDLSSDHLRKIYRGEITDWQDIGGNQAEIMAFQRQENAGSQTLFKKLVLTHPLPPAKVMVIDEMSSLIQAVADYNNAESAIGYNVYYYVSMMRSNPNIKILSIDGVEANNQTIQTGEYPFVNDFYAVIRADEPADSPARILFDFLQGETGKELIEKAGYVPVE